MSGSTIENISTGDLRKYLESTAEERFVLLDVRQPREYEAEHLPGALLIPLAELESRLHEFDPSRELYIYCRTGNRSMVAARFLADSGMGPERIINVVGGITSWFGRKLRGYPRVGGFDVAASDEELIKHIIDLEKGAYRFYKALATKLPESAFGKAVEALSRMEEIHARSAYDHWLDMVPEMPPFEEIFENSKGLVLEGGGSLAEVVRRAASMNAADTLELVELALDIEVHAFDLYRVMADRVGSGAAQRAFLMLAEQEKSHIRLLTTTWTELD
jgi:sulfur-carrier protein adenylyltransferase/sulfurtransferase